MVEDESAIDAAVRRATGRDQKLQSEGAGFSLAAEYGREAAPKPKGNKEREGFIRADGACANIVMTACEFDEISIIYIPKYSPLNSALTDFTFVYQPKR